MVKCYGWWWVAHVIIVSAPVQIFGLLVFLELELVIENSPPLNENLPLTSASGKLSNSAEAVFGIHIVHFNPPLETSVGFERKYLKIGQIALLLTH